MSDGDSPFDELTSPAAVDLPTDAALWVRELAESASRSNKCPRCGGEFDEWFEPAFRGLDRCPFCDLEKGHYDPEADS